MPPWHPRQSCWRAPGLGYGVSTWFRSPSRAASARRRRLDLLGAALRTVGPTVALEHGPNRARGLAHAVAAAGPETRFLVQEIGVASSGAGSLDELLWALEPRAAVITNARSDHLSALGGPDGAAREKVKAVKALPAAGLAVLNADDPRIRAMADMAPCRVVLAGRADDAEVRVVETTLGADGRLLARLAADGTEHVLGTQLVGLPWDLAVVLAFAAAIRLGSDPAEAARAIEAKAPSVERLSVVTAERAPASSSTPPRARRRRWMCPWPHSRR